MLVPAAVIAASLSLRVAVVTPGLPPAASRPP
jgi:hypothetical protein